MKGKTARESHVHRGQPAALPSVRGARSVSRDAARSTVPGPSTGSGCGARLGDGAGGQEEADEDYGHVHQEHRPPAGPEHVCCDEDAAQDLAGDHGQARRRPVQAHGLRPAPARRRRLDGGEDLREHRGRRGALRDARGHKGPGVGARPQASEVRPKAIRPPRNSLRRPKRSPSRPPRTSRTAYASP